MAMNKELKIKKDESDRILESIPKRIKKKEKREFLQAVVNSHMVRLENDELLYSLKLQEKLNKILLDEIA
jgi:hypothetical protein